MSKGLGLQKRIRPSHAGWGVRRRVAHGLRGERGSRKERMSCEYSAGMQIGTGVVGTHWTVLKNNCLLMLVLSVCM